MKKNFYVAPEFEKYAEEFFDIFYRDASYKLSNYMKETVETVKEKYMLNIGFGHSMPDAETFTRSAVPFYGDRLAGGTWRTDQGQEIVCSIYLLLDGSYLMQWRYTPYNENEIVYEDYKTSKGPLDKLELSFEQERPHAWKFPGWKNVPKTIAIPEELLKKAAAAEETIRLSSVWPGLPKERQALRP